ncbi:MAG: hypothetical protein L3J79_04325 [Candidatus Marinimicrobia bacterium]|nr:hypothetical protein [Candidatus Neomarinimicrobiota bacterium]
MRKINLILILLASVVFAQAQVLPEIELGAKGVMSGNFENNNTIASSAVSDFSDSQLLLGFRQKLYNNWRSQMVFGMQFPDADSDLGQVFYNHVFLKLENQKNIFKIGRSTTQTILNEFPTLRDDDALLFNYALNPFADGTNTQDNQYGNVIEYTHVHKQRYWLTFHGENFTNLSEPNNFDLNAYGGSFLYSVPESQRWDRAIIQRLGVSYNNYVDEQTNTTGSDDLLSNILGTVTLNLRPDPVHFIDLKIQGIYNQGSNTVDRMSTYSEYVRMPSISTFGTIRYIYRKLERPFLQTSLGFGYKTFVNLNESEQLIGIANVFYRIGDNFDMGFQYRYLSNRGQTELLFGQTEHKIQLALIYSVSQLFNNQFDTRNSILNLEHKYLE